MLLFPANKIKKCWCSHISYTQLYEKMCELYPLDHCFVGALTLIWIQVVLSVQLVFVCPDLQGWSCHKKEIWELKSQEKVNGLVRFGEKERSIKKTNLPGGQVFLGCILQIWIYKMVMFFMCIYTFFEIYTSSIRICLTDASSYLYIHPISTQDSSHHQDHIPFSVGNPNCYWGSPKVCGCFSRQLSNLEPFFTAQLLDFLGTDTTRWRPGCLGSDGAKVGGTLDSLAWL